MKNKKISIFVIFSFCSIILIPIGLAVMWFSTQWKKKIKIILSMALSVLYAGLIVMFFLLLSPANNKSGLTIPGSYGNGSTEFSTEFTTNKESEKKGNEESEKPSRKESKEEAEPDASLPNSIKKGKGGKNITQWVIILAIIIALILMVIRANLKNRGKGGYENPYVDTEKYKLPLAPDAKLPIVHFLHIHTKQDERILFATETTQKDNEGDFVVTNQRVILLNKNEVVEFPLPVLTAVSSVTNSVMMLISGDRKYYVFMPENQMKYALAVVRWAFAKVTAGK